MNRFHSAEGIPIEQAPGRSSALPPRSAAALIDAAGKRLAQGLGHLLAGIIEAQERHASRQAYAFLRRFSDWELTGMGFDAKQIAALRAGGEVDFSGLGTDAPLQSGSAPGDGRRRKLQAAPRRVASPAGFSEKPSSALGC